MTHQGRYTFLHDVSATAPLVVTVEENLDWVNDGDFRIRFKKVASPHRRYYFWFFGYIAKFPYEREIAIDSSPSTSTYSVQPGEGIEWLDDFIDFVENKGDRSSAGGSNK